MREWGETVCGGWVGKGSETGAALGTTGSSACTRAWAGTWASYPVLLMQLRHSALNRRCCGQLPASMSRLTRLRLLNLDGNDRMGDPTQFATLG